jgi:hypothetical protein
MVCVNECGVRTPKAFSSGVEECGIKQPLGRPRLPDEMVSADGLRMRKTRAERKAARRNRNRYHPGKRAIKPDSEYARAEFKCLLPTIENLRCGFNEDEVERWHTEFIRKMRLRYLTFFHERGMQPPPVSRDLLMT